MKYIKLFERKIEIEDFIKYMLNSYEKDGTFDYIFQRQPLTRKIVKKYVYDYVKKRKKIGVWGGGDGFDREI